MTMTGKERARERSAKGAVVALLSPVSSHFIFVFVYSQFRGHDYISELETGYLSICTPSN